MNQISLHISYLLLTCRKVNVPGLGHFSASYERAAFDPEFGVFYPSRIRIIFENDHVQGDRLLVDSIKRQMNINLETAEKLIGEFVDAIKKKLKRNRYCRLEGIGYLITQHGKTVLKDTFWKGNKYPSINSLQVG